MPGSALRSTARGVLDTLGERGALVVIVGGVGLLVLAAGSVGAPPLVLVGIAALPLILGVGQSQAFALMVGLLVARTIADNSGNTTISIALAMGITGLAVLVLLGTRGVAMPAAALVALAFTSAAAGASTHGATITYSEAFRLMGAIAVVVVAAHAPGRLTVERLAAMVQVIAVVPALLAVYQLATGTGENISGSIRSNGTLSHPNSAAVLFALANLATFLLLLQRRRGRSVQLGLFGLFLAAQASTGSVGGALAMIAMVLTYLFSRPVRRADRVALTVGGLALGALVTLTSSIGAARLAEFANPQPGRPNSFEWRLSAWSEVLAAWRKHVWFGNGLGSTLAKTIVPGNIPHNEYVRLLAEVGLIGFLGVLALALGFAAAIARRGRTSSHPEASSFALAALAGSAVNGLAANTMLYSPSFYVTMLIVGGCWRVLRDTQALPTTTGDPGRALAGQSPQPPSTDPAGVLATTARLDH